MNKCSRPFWALLYLSGHALNFYAVYHLKLTVLAVEREREAALAPEELAAGEKIYFDDFSADTKQKVYVAYACAVYLPAMLVWGFVDAIRDFDKFPDSGFMNLGRGLCGGWRQLFGPARKEAVRKSLREKIYTGAMGEKALKVSNNKPGGFAYILGESIVVLPSFLCGAHTPHVSTVVQSAHTQHVSTVVQSAHTQHGSTEVQSTPQAQAMV